MKHIHIKHIAVALAMALSGNAAPALGASVHNGKTAKAATAPAATPKKMAAAKERALATISIDAAKAHIGFLASDELNGRKAGTRDSRVAAQYIVSLLRQWGIQPLGSQYTQPFSAYSMEWQKKKPWYVQPDSVARLREGTHRRLNMANVLAMIPGTDTTRYVIVGAHFDHVGADPDLEGDQIYNGADDNASGVSAALQIARAFAASGVKPRRNVIFAFWDGEELGLLGSKYFVQTCPFISQVDGYLNFDMIGRNNKPDNPPYVVYFYTESHPVFGQWLKDDIKRYGLNLDPDYRAWDKPVGGSDNGSFALKDIPIIWYHTDGHPDYHQPSDEAQLINYEKVADITRASFLNAWNLANEASY